MTANQGEGMHFGFVAAGLVGTALPEVLREAVVAAEEAGFRSIIAPEHVALFPHHVSRYPYTEDGRMPETKFDLMDPFVALTFAAAHTKRLRIGTGMCILPEHNPLMLAKAVASLDKLSGGRFFLGVGIGWLREEFEALGVPWERRAARAREYVRALKMLWTESEPEFHGEFVNFGKLHMFPKPVQKPHPPIIFGGETDAALKRAGELGDGWYTVFSTPEAVREKLARIRDAAKRADRDPARFEVVVFPPREPDRDLVARYRDAGVTEILLGSPGCPWLTPDAVRAEIDRLVDLVVGPARGA